MSQCTEEMWEELRKRVDAAKDFEAKRAQRVAEAFKRLEKMLTEVRVNADILKFLKEDFVLCHTMQKGDTANQAKWLMMNSSGDVVYYQPSQPNPAIGISQADVKHTHTILRDTQVYKIFGEHFAERTAEWLEYLYERELARISAENPQGRFEYYNTMYSRA